ncbi:MAG: transcriptional activator NhaR [Planctomycetota bacterium]|nr:MAG: transcriptional activator NhaR [Planctomycetota bacterium]
MTWINYHHLLYFWATARNGSITKACEELHLTPQTVSAQIRTLEKSLGEQLFVRAGRRMELTPTGRLVYRYADEIFKLGRELGEALRGQPARAMTLHVGMADALPKLIAHHVLEPALRLEQPVRIVCCVGRTEELLGDLATHQLDVVISDAPIPPNLRLRAYNHLLGESSVTLLGSPALAKRWRRRFPRSIDGMPMLLPTPDTTLRHALDRWFDDRKLYPEVVGEFADSAVLKVFGQHGAGVFPVPTIVEAEVRRQYKVRKVGAIEAVVERFYAISVERRVRHPAVAAICDAARDTIFA